MGVVLFSLALLFYGIILSGEAAVKAFPKSRVFFDRIDAFIEKGAAKLFLSLISLIIGLWNLFSPNFIASAPPIIGALIPSLLLILDSAVIYPELVEILSIPDETKAKYYEFIGKYKGIAGIITFFAGLLHLILFRQILF